MSLFAPAHESTHQRTKSAAWTWRCVWLALASVVVLCDLLSKNWMLDHLRLHQRVVVNDYWNWFLVFNPGAAFSFLSDAGGWQRWFFTALAAMMALWLSFLIYRHPAAKLQAGAMTLMLGGAVGNAIDRLRFGAVVDFIQWHIGDWYWPAFNLADSAICGGAALLMLSVFLAPPSPQATCKTS